MTVTVSNIIPRGYLPNATTTLYTSTSAKTEISKFTLTNGTASNVVVNIYLVASGGTAGATNLVLPNKTIAPYEVYKCPELVGQILESGGFISGIAGTANAIVMSAGARVTT